MLIQLQEEKYPESLNASKARQLTCWQDVLLQNRLGGEGLLPPLGLGSWVQRPCALELGQHVLHSRAG